MIDQRREYLTPKGGILTIIGGTRTASGRKISILECSICSKDTELWEEGSITSNIGNLEKGQIPCGCGCARYSEKQHLLLVQRRATTLHHIVHGFKGKYKGTKTKIKLEEPSSGICWDSTTIGNYFRQGGKSPFDYSGTYRCSDESIIERVLVTGKYSDCTLILNSDEPSYIEYTCGTCSKDEFVREGLCSGVFKILKSTAYKGIMCCRCCGNYRTTKAQREYQIEKICREEGLLFLGWVDEATYSRSHGRIYWVCKNGHEEEKSVGSFLSGSRCHSCFKETSVYWGRYLDKGRSEDTLYLIMFKKSYVKVGRTFNIESRLKSLSRESEVPLEDLEILALYRGCHDDVYDVEQQTHKELYIQGLGHDSSTWSQETFTLEGLGTIKYLLSKTILQEVS